MSDLIQFCFNSENSILTDSTVDDTVFNEMECNSLTNTPFESTRMCAVTLLSSQTCGIFWFLGEKQTGSPPNPSWTNQNGSNWKPPSGKDLKHITLPACIFLNVARFSTNMDGSEIRRKNHLGSIKPCKQWDKLPFPHLVIAGFLVTINSNPVWVVWKWVPPKCDMKTHRIQVWNIYTYMNDWLFIINVPGTPSVLFF